jgi:Uma2 family endonuclease
MSAATALKSEVIGPEHSGMLMTPEEYDAAEFEEGYLYEVVNGVLIVSPPPLEEERDPNDELGYWLRAYRDTNPDGMRLDRTLTQHIIRTLRGRRITDRAIWIGLGRPPELNETPTVAVEFVSKGLRNRRRDYVEKRDE